MAGSIIQERDSDAGATPVTSFSLAFTLNVTPGSVLHLVASWGTPANTPTFTTSQGDAVTPLDTVVDEGLNGQAFAHAYVANAIGGATTVTVTFSALSSFPALWIREIGGVQTLDGHAITYSGGAATSWSVSATNANQPAFWSGIGATGNGPALSAGTGTQDATGWTTNVGAGVSAHASVVTSASQTFTVNSTVSQGLIAIIAIFDLPMHGSTAITVGASGTLSASGALAGSAAITFGGSGTLAGSGALTGTTGITFGATATLAGAGALSASGAVTFGANGTLAASGALVGSAAVLFGATGTLTQPSGALSGTASFSFDATGALRGSGALSGSAAVLFDASGTLTPPFTPTPLPPPAGGLLPGWTGEPEKLSTGMGPYKRPGQVFGERDPYSPWMTSRSDAPSPVVDPRARSPAPALQVPLAAALSTPVMPDLECVLVALAHHLNSSGNL